MTLDSSVEFWSDSKMPYVETRRACQSRTCYKSHSHPTFSIGAVDVGTSLFSSSFAENQKIQAGSLVVIPAHVEHSCNPLPNQAWSYQMMHLDAEWLTQLTQELRQDTTVDLNLIFSETPQFKPNIFNKSNIYESFTLMNRMLFDPKQSILEKEQQLIKFLTDILLVNFDWEKIEISDYYQKFLPQFIECLDSDFENLSLQMLSERIGISRFTLIRLFKHYFGQTPHAYQLNKKINYARKLLKEGYDIAQLAYELEFTDQSHFHRVFKQHTGVTPKQYSKH